MGEDLERKIRKNEKRLRNKQLQESLLTATLFSAAPETCSTLFRCDRGKHLAGLSDGDRLLVRDTGRGRFEVLKAGILIGFLCKPDADGLRALLERENRAAGICLGEVTSFSDVDASFCIKIKPINPGLPKNGDDNAAN